MTSNNPSEILKFAAPHDGLLKTIDQIEADDQSEYIDEISKRIRKCLHFRSFEQLSGGGFSPDGIAETESTNCLGFSLITSELLSLKGIANAIVWANMHAFIMAPGKEDEMWFLHSDLPQLNSQITPEMTTHKSLSNWLSGNEERTSFGLDTMEILRLKGDKLRDKNGRTAKLPWLNFTDPRNERKYSEWQQIIRDNFLVSTSTRDVLGRQMLENMGNFMLAALREQNNAADYLLNMDGVWPEIDGRNLRNNSYQLNKYLFEQGAAGVNNFIEQVDVIADSATSLSNDLSVHLWKPDKLRKVAVATDDIDMLELAIGGYEAILEKRPSNELVKGKLRKAREQLKRLAKKA